MAKAAKTAIKTNKDRSFSSKMTKGEKVEVITTALVIRPLKAENGHYRFKRVLTKMTKEAKEAMGM